ncbi:MAG TPA: sulfotransferase domain-containing protein [Terriglobales bacterium]|nr:sulfotransferase domain-containing protein [Terriglobales bacterium]
MFGTVTCLPDFLIVGAQKAGTTSLADYLTAHPDVIPPKWKEVHFFDLDYHRGLEWYRSHFPVYGRPRLKSFLRHHRLMTGDATPYYIFHPLVPERAFQALPHAKIIVMLRDPVDRAYSHYNHEVRHGHEFLSFEKATEAEESRLKGVAERFSADRFYTSFEHQHFSYVSRGIYQAQIERWLHFYPAEQLLVISSEEFFRNPAEQYKRVLKFLSLPAWELDQYPAQHVGNYPPVSLETKARLQEYYEPHNRALREYLNSKWPGMGEQVVGNFAASARAQSQTV